MKKKSFILIALAAVMLFASLSTSFAGYWVRFAEKTKWGSAFVELKRGKITDAWSNGDKGKAAINVNSSHDGHPEDDSICFNAKIDAKIGGNWIDVTEEKLCFNGDNGIGRITVLPYKRYLSNNTEVRLWGRNRMTLYGGEWMRGSINFN